MQIYQVRRFKYINPKIANHIVVINAQFCHKSSSTFWERRGPLPTFISLLLCNRHYCTNVCAIADLLHVGHIFRILWGTDGSRCYASILTGFVFPSGLLSRHRQVWRNLQGEEVSSRELPRRHLRSSTTLLRSWRVALDQGDGWGSRGGGLHRRCRSIYNIRVRSVFLILLHPRPHGSFDLEIVFVVNVCFACSFEPLVCLSYVPISLGPCLTGSWIPICKLGGLY